MKRLEQHSLPRSLLQRLDLFFLPADGKGLVLDPQCNEAFEAVHLGITEPPSHSTTARLSASMIADFLADHEPVVSRPGRKKLLSRVPVLCFFKRNPVGNEMRSDER